MKNRSVFQDHFKYISNYIINPFRVGILQYAELISYMYDLAKYLTPPSRKGGDYEQTYCTIRNKELWEGDIHILDMKGLQESIQDDMYANISTIASLP